MIYIRKANYHETDQMGVIHHSNHLKYMEEARIAFLDSLGLSYRKMEEEGMISPVNHIELDYLSPILFGDEVYISLNIIEYTGVKISFEYTMTDKDNTKTYLKAKSKHCFVKNNKIISLKREYLDIHNTITEYYEANKTL